MEDPLRTARARRDEYYYRDGLNEIRHGVHSLLLAAMLLGIASRNPAARLGVLAGALAVMIGLESLEKR